MGFGCGVNHGVCDGKLALGGVLFAFGGCRFQRCLGFSHCCLSRLSGQIAQRGSRFQQGSRTVRR